MTPERWHRITEIFHAVLERPSSQADEFLHGACGDDADLYAEVRDMLQEHVRSGFLDRVPPGIEPTAAPPVFSAGQTVSGRYRIVRFLNRGGMGEVYEAEDLELKERVALKTLLPAIAADTRMIARFKQEIQLSRKISHPNVCRVFDLARHLVDGSSSEPTFFLTMEFLPGETLAARLDRERRMESSAALPLMEQMAEALEAAHRSGIIHRDFKPSNVMLAADGAAVRAVVTDFGLARSFGPEPRETTATATGKVMGTLDYMAPELLTGSAASVASDVYALGMVAYRMVTGTLPFPSDTPLAGAILRSRMPVPSPKSLAPDLDPKWERAILRALDPDPSRRFERAPAFVGALRGETAAVTVSLPVMTRRRWIAAALAVVVVVGVWAGWRAWRLARNRPPPEAAILYQKGVDDIHAGAYFAATKALGEAVHVAPHFGLAHARLAEAWVSLDLYEKASQEMLLARRQDIAALSQLERLQVEAIDLTITREFAAAAAKYVEMAKMTPGDADLAVDLGRAWENAGKQDKAIESYRRAAEATVPNPAAWLKLAILYSRSGNTAKSDEAFARAEGLYQLTSNLEGLTELAFQRGTVATARGQYVASAAHLRQAMETARLAGNLQQEVRAKLQMGTNAYASGDAAAAEEYARDALETARANRIESLAVRGLVTLGAAYQRKRDYARAEAHFQEALALARSANADRVVALCQISLAALHDEQIKPDLSAREATEALGFYQSNGFLKETFQCHILLGRAHLRRGEIETALSDFQHALVAAKKAQDDSLEDLAEESMGTAFLSLQNFPEALAHFRKELVLSRSPERRGYAGLNCAHMLWMLGRYQEASSALDAAEADAAKVLSLRLGLLRERADMALSQNHYAEAIALARRELAADTGQNPRTNSLLTRTLGLALSRSGQRTEGLRRCRESLALDGTIDDPLDLLDARLALIEALLAVGDRPGALSVFHDAEPMLARYPASRWRGLALISHADRQYAPPARDALDEIRRGWGEPAFAVYLSRPDFALLARPLLHSVSANLK